VYPTTVGNLRQTLQAHVPGRTAQDVNVRQLIQKFGRKPRIDVVVVSGVFNSLAPDEGITGPGTVVVLVDAVTHRVFDNFIMD
jgi:homoaconitase/3-isopropylmalate dehydratase large subunit